MGHSQKWSQFFTKMKSLMITHRVKYKIGLLCHAKHKDVYFKIKCKKQKFDKNLEENTGSYFMKLE